MSELRAFLPWLLGTAAVAIIASFWSGAISLPSLHQLLHPSSFVASVSVDRDTYYRLKVKLAYKGEPQDFDIVVGCNVRQISYKYGGRTYEPGLIPSVFGRRMADGKALVVRPPNACDGQTTANGHVQPDLRPVVVVYDNADTLDFGVAYLSEDAYESPLSLLTFGGATIETATRRDFDRFRRAQANVVTRATYWTGAAHPADMRKRMGLEPAAKQFGRLCEGYQRYRLSDDLRALVRQHWPTGAPRYWIGSYDLEDALHRSVFFSRKALRSDGNDDPPHRPWTFGDGAADLGLPTRTGGGLVTRERGTRGIPAYYPAASDYRTDRWPSDKADQANHAASLDKIADMHVDFRGGKARGFAYCAARAHPDADLKAALSGKRLLGRVDGEDAASVRPGGGPSFIPMWILERDEFALHYFPIGLGTMRGDV